MKVIFPSFAWFALAAATAWGQAAQRPPSLSISPADAQVNPAATAPATQTNGVASTPVAPAPDNSATASDAAAAEQWMQRVIATNNEMQSLQARIRYRANLFGAQTVGAGMYLQQGTGDQRQFRLELKTSIGQQILTSQQVCDGKFVWQLRDTFNKSGGGASERPTISRIDLAKVRQTLQDSGQSGNVDALRQLAVGGLPKLLASLHQSFRFNRVQAGQLDTLPVWKAVGSWTPGAISALGPELASQASLDQPLNLKLLPAQVPEQIWLYLGQDDLFPYRIEFRRHAAQGRGGEGKRDLLPIVTLEFYEVRVNTPINPHEFDYQPGDADIIDNTAAFLKEVQGK